MKSLLSSKRLKAILGIGTFAVRVGAMLTRLLAKQQEDV